MQLKNVRHFLFYIFVDHDIVRISWGNLLCVHFPFIVDILLKMSFCSFQWPTTCRSFWREASFRLYANSWETHRASGMENEKITCLDSLSIDPFSFTACFFRLIVQKLEISVLNIPKPSQLLLVPNSLLMKLICLKFCCSLRIKSNG